MCGEVLVGHRAWLETGLHEVLLVRVQRHLLTDLRPVGLLHRAMEQLLSVAAAEARPGYPLVVVRKDGVCRWASFVRESGV